MPLKPGAGRWAAVLIALFSAQVFAQAPHPAAGKPLAIAERLQACAACHGADGNSLTAGVPSIAAQPRIYLENALVLTREGLRGNAVMQALMKGLSDREIIAIATHFSALPARSSPGTADQALLQKGRVLAGNLRCGVCHLPHYRGREQMPRLAGQREEVLNDKMIAFRDKPPPGTDTIMSASLYGVSDADIKAMGHFLAHLR